MALRRILTLFSGEAAVRGFAGFRLAVHRELARLALIGLAFGAPLSAEAACREAAASTLPMPTWTWLRGWRADFSAPSRLATDGAGRVFATDPGKGQVVWRGADGAMAGRRTGLGKPTGIAVDASGNILVGDQARGRVTFYDEQWNARHALGVGDGEFGLPGDIAIDPANGEIYVSDNVRHVVAVYSSAGLRLRTIGAPAPNDDSPAADGLFRAPTGITIAGNELLVADQLNFRVQAFDKTSGAFLYCIGNYRASSIFSPASGPARLLGMPQGLWVDAAGRLFVADAYQGQIHVIDRDNGARIGSIGAPADTPGALNAPSGILIDAHGRLFVASSNNARLDMFGLDAYADPERYAPAAARMIPERIERPGTAARLQAHVELPGYRAIDIDPASVRINGLTATGTSVQDGDGNGIPELLVSVNAAALLPTLGAGDSAPVRVIGTIGRLRFDATTSIAIVERQIAAPPPRVMPPRARGALKRYLNATRAWQAPAAKSSSTKQP